MAAGGFVKLPGGTVVVALSLPRPRADQEGVPPRSLRVRVVVHAPNRARALTRLRNLGLRAVYLRGNTQPPTPDEISAVLHHPDGLVWRDDPDDGTEFWHPIRTLLHPSGPSPARHPGAATAAAPGHVCGDLWEFTLAQWSAALQPPGEGLTERP